MVGVDLIFATYLIAFEFKEFSPFWMLFLILDGLLLLLFLITCVKYYLFSYQSILSGCKKTQKSVCAGGRRIMPSSSSSSLFFGSFSSPLFKYQLWSLQMFLLAKTFAPAHINVLFHLFVCFECSKFPYLISNEQQIPLFNKQLPHVKFFRIKESSLDFSTALCLYSLIKHW